MKKVLNIALATLTFAFIGTIDAKIMKHRTIPVTKNTKNLLIDAKNIEASTTPEEKEKNIKKLVGDAQKDPYMVLKSEEAMKLEEIKDKEEEIATMEAEQGYTSYFFLESEELSEARNEKADLYQALEKIQLKLGKIREKQPAIETKIKDYSFYKLVGVAGLAALTLIALYRYGYLSKIWGSEPSFPSTAPSSEMISNISETVPATPTSAASTWGQTASNVITSAKDILLSGAMTGAASYIGNKVYKALMDLEEAEKDPSVTPEQLQDKIDELKYFLDEFKAQQAKNK